MPRHALVLITTLVLAAHWLVLGAVPLGQQNPVPPVGPVFSTRSISVAALASPPGPADPTSPAAAPLAPIQPPAAQPAAPRQNPPPKSTLRNATARSMAAPTVPEPGDTQAAGTPAQAPILDTSTPSGALPDDAVATIEPEPASPAPATPSSDLPASAPQQIGAPAQEAAPATSAGLDIRAPGSAAGQAAGTAPPPVRLPPPTRLAFDVSGQAKKLSYSARAELLWQHDGSRYEARQEISAFLVGSRVQRSVGAITAQGLAPERFSDRSRSEQAAHFDYQKGRVTFSANTPEAAADPGVQDRLSVFIQLGALLAADPARFVPGTQITMTTVSARGADRWAFTIEGPDTLDLPAGTLQVLKLQRLPRKEYDQKAELWVAPALGYLPVRIKLTQANGDYADLLLRSSSPP